MDRVRVSASRRPLISAILVAALVAGLVGVGLLGKLQETTALTVAPSPPAPLTPTDSPTPLPSASPRGPLGTRAPAAPIPGLGIEGVVAPPQSLTRMRLAEDTNLTAFAAAGHRFYYVAQGGSVIRLVDPVYSRLDLPLARLAAGHQAVRLAAAGDWLAWVETWSPGPTGPGTAAGCAPGSSRPADWQVVLANVVTGLGGPVLQSQPPAGTSSGHPCAPGGLPLIALSADAYAYTIPSATPGTASASTVEIRSIAGHHLLWRASPGLAVSDLELANDGTIAVVGTPAGQARAATRPLVVVLRRTAPSDPVVTLPTDGGVALSGDASTLLFDGPAVPAGLAAVRVSHQSAVWSVSLDGSPGPRLLAPGPTAAPGSAADAPAIGGDGGAAVWREGTPDGTSYAVVDPSVGAARALLGMPGPLWASVQLPWVFWVGFGDGRRPVLYSLRFQDLGFPRRSP